MKETNFIAQKQKSWRDLEDALAQKKRQDPEELSKLYVQVTDDLSYARTYYKNRSVKVYLNHLAQQLFYNVYKNKGLTLQKIKHFITDGLPQATWESRFTYLTSFIVFFIAVAIGVVSSHMQESFPSLILGDSYIDMTIENIRKGDPMAVYKSQNEVDMFLMITLNNLKVDFICFITGVFFGIGSFMVLVRNGLMLGAFQYLFIKYGSTDADLFFKDWGLGIGIALIISLIGSLVFVSRGTFLNKGRLETKSAFSNQMELLLLSLPIVLVVVSMILCFALSDGVFRESFFTIWIHGTLEIGGAVIAGAAGLELGKGLLFPGTYTRLQSFQLSARRGIKILMGVVPITILAGFNESFITRQTEMPDILRGSILILSLAFLIAYFVILPYQKAKQGFKDTTSANFATTLSDHIAFGQILDISQLINQMFTLYRQYLQPIVLIAAGSALFYTLGLYLLDSKLFSEELSYINLNWFAKKGPEALWESTMQYLYLYQTPYLAVVYTIAFSAIIGYASFILHKTHYKTTQTFLQFLFSKGSLFKVLGVVLLSAGILYIESGSIVLLFLGITPCLVLLADLIQGQGIMKSLKNGFSYTINQFPAYVVSNLLIYFIVFLFLTVTNAFLVSFIIEAVNWLVTTESLKQDTLYVAVNTFCTLFTFGLIVPFYVFSAYFIHGSAKEILEATHALSLIEYIGQKKSSQGIVRE